MQQDDTQMLIGLPSICAYIGACRVVVRRWIREEGFPAHLHSDGKYRAVKQDVLNWLSRKARSRQ